MISDFFQTLNSWFTKKKYPGFKDLMTFSEMLLSMGINQNSPEVHQSPFQAMKMYLFSYMWKGTADFSSAPLVLLFLSYFSPTLSFTSFSMLPLIV